jgi:hypothetical protein
MIGKARTGGGKRHYNTFVPRYGQDGIDDASRRSIRLANISYHRESDRGDSPITDEI